MIDWIVWLMETLGAPGAGVAVALESIFPPIPSEIVLPLAGFTASRGTLDLAAVLIWTTIGSLVGAIVLYWLGRTLGLQRLVRAAERMPLTKGDDVERTNAWFGRHGVKAVFFGRMVPIFRSLISIPAGVRQMSLGTFVIFTTAGSLIWNSVLVLAGFALGEQWHHVESSVGVFQKIVILLVFAAATWFVVSRVRERREAKAPAE